jgi:hypothetical protein
LGWLINNPEIQKINSPGVFDARISLFGAIFAYDSEGISLFVSTVFDFKKGVARNLKLEFFLSSNIVLFFDQKFCSLKIKPNSP